MIVEDNSASNENKSGYPKLRIGNIPGVEIGRIVVEVIHHKESGGRVEDD